jgi:hypothetical protein
MTLSKMGTLEISIFSRCRMSLHEPFFFIKRNSSPGTQVYRVFAYEGNLGLIVKESPNDPWKCELDNGVRMEVDVETKEQAAEELWNLFMVEQTPVFHRDESK